MKTKGQNSFSPATKRVFFWTIALQTAAAPAFANGLAGPMPNMPHGNRHGHQQGSTILSDGGSNSRGNHSIGLASHFGLGMMSLPKTHQRDFSVQSLQSPEIKLDLTSNANSLTLDPGAIKHGSSVTITVGGDKTTFHAGDKVTPAELLAILQAQSGGQKITVGSDGHADGGSFSLNRLTASDSPVSITDIVIAKDVSARDVLNGRSNLSLSGDLVNYGTIRETGGGSHASANLSAQNIVNQDGAVITTRDRGANSSVDLSLTAQNDFTNRGTIDSSGALAITAGGTITNAGAGATLTATADVNLTSATTVNSGAVTSTNGNINLNSNNGALAVSNTGGTISAVNGAINVNYQGTSIGTVTGGDLLSQNVNLNSGDGTLNVMVDKLTGTLNSTGNAVHVQASTDNLVLGTQCLADDPTFYNQGGNIVLDGDFVVGESLAIIAAGDITATVNLTQMATTDGFGQGHPISLIAGANVTGTGGANIASFVVPPGVAATTASFTGASATGGSVNLSGATNGFTIETNSTAGNKSGADLTVAAYRVGAVGGDINLTNGTIDASASGTGINGTVTLVAPHTIILDSIQNGGGGNGAANLIAINSQPTFSSGAQMDFNSTGNVTTGNAIVGDFTNIVAAGTITTLNQITLSGNATLAAGSGVTIGNGSGSGFTQDGALTITSKSADIAINDQISASGGITIVGGGAVRTNAGGWDVDTNNGAVNSGDMIVVAGANYTQTASTITVTGASVLAGNIDFGTQPIGSLDLSSNNGNGGNLTLIAFADAGGAQGTYTMPNGVTAFTGGAGPGFTNGNVLVVCGNNQGSATAGIGNTRRVSFDTTPANSAPTATGSITLVTAKPDTTTSVVTINQNAQITQGNFYTGQALTNATISGGTLATDNSFILAQAGTQVTIRNATGNGGNNSLFVDSLGGVTLTGGFVDTLRTSIDARGAVSIAESVFSPFGVSIVAGGNISSAGAVTVATDYTLGNGGALTMIAGANYVFNSSTITVTGASATGGIINLASIGQLSSVSTFNGGNGGDINLVAFATGAGAQGTVVVRGGATIASGGSGSGINGDVTVVAGNNLAGNTIGTAGNPISIDTTGGLAGTGNITLSCTTPNTVPNPVVQRADGLIAVGDFLGGAIRTASVRPGVLTTSNANVKIIQGNAFNIAGPLATGSNLAILSLGTITVSSAATASSISLLGQGILLGADVVCPGGVLLVSGTSISSSVLGVNLATDSATGNAGNITAIAGAAFTWSGDTVTITGASATGGKIDFTTSPIASLSARSTAAGGAGGNITLSSFLGSGGSSTIFADAAGVTIHIGGGAGGANGSLTVVADGAASPAIRLPNIDATAGSNTGSINVKGATPSVTAGNPLVLTSGFGAGTIQSGSVLLNGANAVDIIAGNITMPGATVITSGHNVQLGTLNATGGLNGNAGSFNISTNSATDLLIGALSANSILGIDISGAGGGGNAGALTLQNLTGGINVNATNSILYGVTAGNGATLHLICQTGLLSLPSAVASTTIDVSGAGAAGTGGVIDFQANDINWANSATQDINLIANGSGNAAGGTVSVSIGSAGPTLNIGTATGNYNLSANSGALDGNGGTLAFFASSRTVVVDGSALSVTSAGNGAGGSISLQAADITAFNPATQPLILTATGSGNGNGGLLSVSTTSNTSSLTVGLLPGNIELICNSGTGNGGAGGSVSVLAGVNLTVNPAAISAGPLGQNGNGASITLGAGQAATGTLLVTGTLNVNGVGSGFGGTIGLISNSTTPFTIGKTKLSGVVGLSLSGLVNGNIVIQNLAGSIVQSAALPGINSAIYTAGGAAGAVTINGALGNASSSSITITASGSGSITGKGLMSANTVVLSGSTGAIGGKSAVKVSSANVTANSGGAINISDAQSALLNASQSTNSTFSFTASGDLTTLGNISGTSVTLGSSAVNGNVFLNANVTATSATGVALLTAKGSGTVADVSPGAYLITAPTVSLVSTSGTLGSVATPLRINTSNLSAATTGSVNIINSGLTPLLLTGGGKTTNAFSLTSAGDINTGKVVLKTASFINLNTQNNGNIILNSAQGGTSTVGISLSASGSGNITAGKAGKLTANSYIHMNSLTGNIGTAAQRVSVNAPKLSFNTGGDGAVFATSSGKTAATLQNSSAGAGFSLAAGSGGLTVNNLSAGSSTTIAGGITLTASGGAIKTITGGTITTGVGAGALGGGITINNTGSKGNIEFGTNSTVSSFSTTAGGGAINVVVGKLPPPLVVGTLPGNVLLGGSTTNLIFFNNGITANGPTNNLNSFNTNLVFSAANANQIKLDGGVTITADPLLPAAFATASDTKGVIRAMVVSTPTTAALLPSSATTSGASSSKLDEFSAQVFPSNTSSANTALLALRQNNAISTGRSLSDMKVKSGWISDTELVSGEIPATFVSDLDFGVEASPDSADLQVRASADGTGRSDKVLSRGSLLVAPVSDTVINTRFGDVSIAADALVLVSCSSHGVAVFNLHDKRKSSVSLTAGGKNLSVSPGTSLVITNRLHAGFEDVNPAQLVAYRNLSEIKVSGGLKAFHAEFSAPTAINAVGALKTLLASKNPQAIRLSRGFLKTTSVLMQLQASGQDFRQILRPQIAAYLP